MSERDVPSLASGRSARRALSPVRIARAATRTGNFAVRSARLSMQRDRTYPEVPVPRPTAGRLLSVFGEELLMAAAEGLDERVTDPDELARISADTDQALALFEANDWLARPATFHTDPPPPRAVRSERRSILGVRYERVSFESGYEPVEGMPGAQRWSAMTPNRTMYANVLRHREGPRPWLVYVHGHDMGRPLDLLAADALGFHRDLGFNVLAPVLPLHGERSAGTTLVSMDWVANVHGLSQAVWDVRRCLEWIRQQEPTAIAIHGVSLGGYVGALTAALDDDVRTVVAGVPSAAIHTPLTAAITRSRTVRRSFERHGLLDHRTEQVHRVVTPTAMDCRVPHHGRFIYAGIADRLASPSQPYRLWEHWDRPHIHWSQSSHTVTMMSRRTRRFVRRAVASSVAEPETGSGRPLSAAG